MKFISPLFGMIVFLGIWSCGQTERQPGIEVQDTIPVKLMSLRQIGVDGKVEATGVFTTESETLLGFKNGGVISRIYVSEGETIRKGQRLASVQSGDLDATSGQARIGLEKAERDYTRAKRLYEDSVATLEQMQNAKSAFDAAKEDLNAVSYNQQHLHIYAPVSGYVLAKLASEGQVVGPGTPVLQVNGASQGKWTLKVGVSDTQWAAIQVGDESSITTDALPNQQLRGKVAKKSEALDPQSGTFTIFIDIVDNPGKLATGVFAKAIIQTRASATEQQWQIPYEALVDANGKEAYVFITLDGRYAVKQRIILTDIQKDWVMVASGLDSAASLIISGSPYLTDGTPIIVQK